MIKKISASNSLLKVIILNTIFVNFVRVELIISGSGMVTEQKNAL